MKRTLGPGALAAVLTALVGLPATGPASAAATHLWSVAVHIEYPDGFVYDHAFATGLSTAELPTILQACGKSHAYGSAVRYHCYAIPE